MSYDEAMRQRHLDQEYERRRVERAANDRFAWKLTMLVLPWVGLAAVALYWTGYIANRSVGPYRSALSAVLPQGWVAQRYGDGHNNAAVMITVGLVMLTLVVGVSILRRIGTNRWYAGDRSRAVLWLWCFVTTLLRVLILIAVPGFVLTAGAIAEGADLVAAQQGAFDHTAQLRAWPLILTGAVALWFSLGSTMRSIRKAERNWFKARWQGLDGRWYHPVQPAGTWDRDAGLWLATDGGWYPPPADSAGPIGPGTGWWQGSDGNWYPPQNWAPRALN